MLGSPVRKALRRCSLRLYANLYKGLRLPVIALMMALVATAVPSHGVTQPFAKAAWTLIIYEDPDNSLETPQLANVKEMLQVGSSEKVQVIMLCDRLTIMD